MEVFWSIYLLLYFYIYITYVLPYLTAFFAFRFPLIAHSLEVPLRERMLWVEPEPWWERWRTFQSLDQVYWQSFDNLHILHLYIIHTYTDICTYIHTDWRENNTSSNSDLLYTCTNIQMIIILFISISIRYIQHTAYSIQYVAIVVALIKSLATSLILIPIIINN